MTFCTQYMNFCAQYDILHTRLIFAYSVSFCTQHDFLEVWHFVHIMDFLYSVTHLWENAPKMSHNAKKSYCVQNVTLCPKNILYSKCHTIQKSHAVFKMSHYDLKVILCTKCQLFPKYFVIFCKIWQFLLKSTNLVISNHKRGNLEISGKKYQSNW